jgi:para-nitrobenzyl esterase
VPDRAAASEWAGDLLTELGIAKAVFRRLQEVPVAQILDAQAKMELKARGAYPRKGFVPTAGTPDLPLQPVEAVARGDNHVPLIIGSVMHEMALMLMGMGIRPDTIDDARLTQLAGMFWRDKAGEMLAGYKANHPGFTPGDLMVRMWSDSMRMGEIELAEAQVKAGTAPVWMYLFAWETPVLPYLHAAHGIDGSFYFDNTEVLPMTQGNPGAARLASKTSTAWANFAKAGKPVAPGLPKWPTYSLDKRETMIFGETSHIGRDPMGADRELRMKLGVMT